MADTIQSSSSNRSIGENYDKKDSIFSYHMPVAEGSGTETTEKRNHKEIADLDSNEVLEGEQPMINAKADCIKRQETFHGKFIMTNYRVAFIPVDYSIYARLNLRPSYFNVPLGLLSNITKVVHSTFCFSLCMDFSTKDGRKFRILFSTIDKTIAGEQIYNRIKLAAFSASPSFAFLHKPTFPVDGWTVYIDVMDWARMGIDYISEDSPLKIHTGNSDWSMSSTYPRRMIAPMSMTAKDLEECAKSRSRGRLPILSYYLKTNGATLWRSSQPKEGILGGVNKADKKMMKSILETLLPFQSKDESPHFSDPKQDKATLHIYDARSKMAAFGNKIKGSGYENLSNYPFAWLKFCDIGNIHTMRESYVRLLEVCGEPRDARWLEKLDKTGWLCHISTILKSANEMAESIQAGKVVLVHCSDGWDRTSQLCALVQILLDPYYRTLEGFEVVIEKEFVWSGHQFSQRLGHGVENTLSSSLFCPVFLQFLDCTWQIIEQFPGAFEFTQQLLKEIAYHAFSLRFGTFIGNCEKQRKDLEVRKKTVSLWSYINTEKDKYMNPGFMQAMDKALVLETSVMKLKVWEDQYVWEGNASTGIEKAMEMVKEVKAKEEESKAKIAEAEKELQNLMQKMKANGILFDS